MFQHKSCKLQETWMKSSQLKGQKDKDKRGEKSVGSENQSRGQDGVWLG